MFGGRKFSINRHTGAPKTLGARRFSSGEPSSSGQPHLFSSFGPSPALLPAWRLPCSSCPSCLTSFPRHSPSPTLPLLGLVESLGIMRRLGRDLRRPTDPEFSLRSAFRSPPFRPARSCPYPAPAWLPPMAPAQGYGYHSVPAFWGGAPAHFPCTTFLPWQAAAQTPPAPPQLFPTPSNEL